MELRCLKDTCPETGKSVDMRRCCGEHAWNRACKFYGEKPWSEYLYATCNHPHAQAHWASGLELASMTTESFRADINPLAMA